MTALAEVTAQPVWDVVVVGAGPAGSMTAYELARRGTSVLAVDRVAHPRWKVCGACLNPGTQRILRDAGLGHVLEANRPVRLHTLRLGGWGRRAEVALRSSVALSRRTLDHGLAQAAEDAGATLLAPARASLGPVRGNARVVTLQVDDETAEVRARLVVAADGLTSPTLTRALEGHPPRVAPGSRMGFGGVFAAAALGGPVAAYEAGVVHMAVGDGGYVGLVRQEDGSLDVAAALDPEALAGSPPEQLLEEILLQAGFPILGGTPDTGWRGTPRLTRRPEARGAERVLAVGDAAGYVEPFTGEGIGWALAAARTLGPIALEGVRSWSPQLVARWDADYRAGVGRSALLCRGLARGLRHPWLTRAGLDLLRLLPGAAAPVVRLAATPPTTPAWSPQ